ncbi:AAA family ATPase, partial [Ursidibacter sp. B-7004-1]
NNNTELNILILDEVELALHPSSQNRLIDFLNEIANKYNFCVYFSTHSPQIISKIHPNKIFHIEKKCSGKLEINNPCYPAYATRVLYEPNGFDLVILVEDELAKFIIEKIINDNDINKNKLIKIVPTGGWEKTLELALDFKQSYMLGSQCQIITILDGDIKTDYEKEYLKNHSYESLKKQFLPIPSAEKYLWTNLIEDPNDDFIDKLGRSFFQTR